MAKLQPNKLNKEKTTKRILQEVEMDLNKKA